MVLYAWKGNGFRERRIDVKCGDIIEVKQFSIHKVCKNVKI